MNGLAYIKQQNETEFSALANSRARSRTVLKLEFGREVRVSATGTELAVIGEAETWSGHWVPRKPGEVSLKILARGDPEKELEPVIQIRCPDLKWGKAGTRGEAVDAVLAAGVPNPEDVVNALLNTAPLFAEVREEVTAGG